MLLDCIGGIDDGCCGTGRYELYADDTLVLTSGNYYHGRTWCDKLIIVRRNEVRDDECSGCTLSIRFESHSAGSTSITPGSEVSLMKEITPVLHTISPRVSGCLFW